MICRSNVLAWCMDRYVPMRWSNLSATTLDNLVNSLLCKDISTCLTPACMCGNLVEQLFYILCHNWSLHQESL